jgi:hypothetical protein
MSSTGIEGFKSRLAPAADVDAAHAASARTKVFGRDRHAGSSMKRPAKAG